MLNTGRAAHASGLLREKALSKWGQPWRLPLVLVWAFLWAELAAIPGESPTVDEQAHLARGLTYGRTGDLRLYIGHPPLVNLLQALPLLPDGRIQLPLDDVTWQRADWIEFPITLFWKGDNPARLMFHLGRAMVVLLGLLLLAVVYRLGTDLGGPAVGQTAMLLAALDPNLRAHARLATTDVGVTLALALLALTWRRWQKPASGLLPALGAGLALGLALASKYTALVWVAALLAATVVRSYLLMRAGSFAASLSPLENKAEIWGVQTTKSPARPSFRESSAPEREQLPEKIRRPAGGGEPEGSPRWRSLAGILLVAGLVLWATYRFEARPLWGLPFPVPLATFWDEFVWSVVTVTQRQAYLLGRVSREGFLAYFPVALLVKTPLPILALAAAGLALWLARRWRAELSLWAPPLVFFAAAVYARINIGYRHILPILPLLYIGGALALARLWRARARAGRWAALGLAGWLAAGSALVYPRDLTYFNELAGGPDNGHRVLVDSNLDWGQDLDKLAEFVRQRGIDSIYVSYFGSVPVAYVPVKQYPLPARPLPPHPAPGWHPLFPAPGWYAISLTHLVGGAVLEDIDAFAYFRHRQPEAVLGGTIYVYRIPDESGTVAVCVNPPPSMGAGGVERIFGASATRRLEFDCGRGLPLPAGRAWYLLRGEQAQRLQPALRRLGAALVYDEPHRQDPAYALSLYRLEDAAGRAAVYPDHPQAPATFGGLAEFLGWRYAQPPRPGQPAQVETAWRLEAALPEPVSIFLHLTASDGQALQVGDGLNTAFDVLRPGDALIQFHPLSTWPDPLPPGAELRTGLYALRGDYPRYYLPDGRDFVALRP